MTTKGKSEKKNQNKNDKHQTYNFKPVIYCLFFSVHLWWSDLLVRPSSIHVKDPCLILRVDPTTVLVQTFICPCVFVSLCRLQVGESGVGAHVRWIYSGHEVSFTLDQLILYLQHFCYSATVRMWFMLQTEENKPCCWNMNRNRTTIKTIKKDHINNTRKYYKTLLSL